MRPVEVGTCELLGFLERVLPAPPLAVLEVGCGRGELAAALLAGGYAVTAVDVDPEAVAAAREAGVPALLADFLAGPSGPHDAVLFARSLHHVADLDRAAALAAAACRPGGLVVVDDFARERADAATAAWFFDLRGVLAATGVLAPPAPPPAAAGLGPLDRWQVEYGDRREHRLHTGAELVAALRRHLDVEAVEGCPFLYRQLAQWLEPCERGVAVARRLLELEVERLERGELEPLGLRVVARRPA